ncbi:MAG: hypothetical protein IJF83_07565 [Methanobrevibacter sp.]|nr:hypothetical protein [Methanobrevibacter sp.]
MIPQNELLQMIYEEQRKQTQLLEDIKKALKPPITLQAAPMTEENKNMMIKAIEGIETVQE